MLLILESLKSSEMDKFSFYRDEVELFPVNRNSFEDNVNMRNRILYESVLSGFKEQEVYDM
jgi:hypothetical protein